MTAPPSDWSSSTSWAWACSPPCTTWSIWSRPSTTDHRPGPPRTGARRLRPVVPGRHRGGVPGGVAGPDGHPAPGPAPLLLRPGHRSRPHPPRTHPGERRPPLHPASQREGAGHLSAPVAPAGPRTHPRGPPLPGTAHADRHRRGRVHPHRGRRAAPGHERQAVGERMARLRDRLFAGMATRGCPRRWPSRSSWPWPPSPTSASPKATRWPSPIWCTPPPGARCTIRPPSPPDC